MKNSLVLLVVLVLVILVAIFLSSPKCREAVTSVFKKSNKKANAELDKKSTRDPASRAIKEQSDLAKLNQPVSAGLDQKEPRDAASEAIARQREAARRGVPVAGVLDRNKTRDAASLAIEQQREAARLGLFASNAKEDFLLKRREAQGQVDRRKPRPPVVPLAAQPLEVQAEQHFTPQMEVQAEQHIAPQQASFRVLNGTVEDMFNTKVDVQAEFGISEEELDRLAMDYKKRHLDAPQPERLRNRAIRRTDLERSEQVLRSSFVKAAALNTRMNTEEFTVNALRKNIINAETTKQKPVRGRLAVTPQPE